MTDRYGSMTIESVQLTEAWYREHMPPYIDTPARPFLGLWPEHEDLVVEALHRHFTKALK